MTLRVCARPPRALLLEGWEKSPRTCPLALWHFAEGTSIAPCSSELVHHICALEVTGEATPPTARESLILAEYTQVHTHTHENTDAHSHRRIPTPLHTQAPVQHSAALRATRGRQESSQPPNSFAEKDASCTVKKKKKKKRKRNSKEKSSKSIAVDGN